MNLFTKSPMLKLDQKTETSGDPASSGYTGDNGAQSQASTTDNTQTQESGDQFDDLGYPVTPETPAKKEESSQKEPEKSETKEETSEKSLTSYDVEPPKPEEVKVEDKKKDSEKEEAATEDTFKITDKGDLLDEEVKELEEFINAQKLSKEAAEALVNLKRNEAKREIEFIKSKKEEEVRLVNETRHQWFTELKGDKTFGGENFAANLKKVDKVINDFMPGLKKHLTENPRMLPPFVMRDLAKLADTLYNKGKTFEQGEPSVPEKPDDDSPLAFYE
jgi:hypothetical protein